MEIGTVMQMVTAVVALYGAGLATYNARQARRNSRANLEVDLTFGMLVLDTDTGQRTLSDQMFLLAAANHGPKTVTLTMPGLLVNGRQMMLEDRLGTEVSFPHELAEGKSVRAWAELDKIRIGLLENGMRGKVEITAFFYDGVGAMHKSRSKEIDLEVAA